MSDLDTPPSMNELMIKYFVPPVTTMYMQWGETIMVIIFFLVMFVGLGYWYVYSNYSDIFILVFLSSGA